MAEQLTLYRFNELTEEAKLKAIAKLRQSREWQEEVDERAIEAFREDATEELKGYGLPTDDLRYSFTHSQGDGVAFYGEVTYSDDLLSMLEDAYGLAMPHAEAIRKWVEAQGHLGIYIEKDDWDNYNHANTMRVELNTDNYETMAEDILINVDGWDLVDPENADEYDEARDAYVDSFTDAFDALQESMYSFINALSTELHSQGYAILEGYDSDENARAYAEWAYDFPVLTEDGDKVYIGWDFCGR